MDGGVDVLTAQFAEARVLDCREVSFSIQGEEERTRERYSVRSKIANTEVSRPVWTVTGSIRDGDQTSGSSKIGKTQRYSRRMILLTVSSVDENPVRRCRCKKKAYQPCSQTAPM